MYWFNRSFFWVEEGVELEIEPTTSHMHILG